MRSFKLRRLLIGLLFIPLHDVQGQVGFIPPITSITESTAGTTTVTGPSATAPTFTVSPGVSSATNTQTLMTIDKGNASGYVALAILQTNSSCIWSFQIQNPVSLQDSWYVDCAGAQFMANALSLSSVVASGSGMTTQYSPAGTGSADGTNVNSFLAVWADVPNGILVRLATIGVTGDSPTGMITIDRNTNFLRATSQDGSELFCQNYLTSHPCATLASMSVNTNNSARIYVSVPNGFGFGVGETADGTLTLAGIGVGAAAPASGITSTLYKTVTNCSSNASPAVCAAAPAGAVAIPTGVNSTLTVNTTAVTATSEIVLFSDDSLTVPSTTCNSTLATLVGGLAVTSRSVGTSFTISYNGTITTNKLCVSYHILN